MNQNLAGDQRNASAVIDSNWQPQPASLPPTFTFYDKAAPEESNELTWQILEVDKETSAAIRAFCDTQRYSHFEIWLALVSAYLSRCSSEDRFPIMASTSHWDLPEKKNPEQPERHSLTLEVDAPEERSLAQLLLDVTANIEMVEHKQPKLVAGAAPSLPTLDFSYTKLESSLGNDNDENSSSSHNITGWPGCESGQVFVLIDVLDAGEQLPFQIRLGVRIPNDSSLPEFALKHLVTLVREIIAKPDLPIGGAPMITGDEEDALNAMLDTRSQYPETPATFMAKYRLWVERAPTAIAVQDAETSLTYAQLDERVDKLAQILFDAGVNPGDRVAVCLQRSSDLVTALLAVLDLGGVYVPIDPNNPQQRIAAICKVAEPAAVLVHEETRPLLAAQHTAEIVLKAEYWTQVSRVRNAPRGQFEISNIIFTSGSTGIPKGVAITHRGLANHLESMCELLEFDRNGRMLALTTAAFDAAIMEMCLPLWSGGTVEIISEASRRDPFAIAQLLFTERKSTMFATPATWQMLIDKGWQGNGKLQASCGGETLTRSLADALLERSAEVWNIYGPTETTVCSTVEKVRFGEVRVAIGKPVRRTYLRILNAYGQTVPRGVSGELYIGGEGVAAGYFNQPGLTQERFLTDNGDSVYKTGDLVRCGERGELHYVGRIDNQVKLRGYRIETGEVESALRTCQAIQEAVVVLRGDTLADRHLVSFFTADKAVDTSEIVPQLHEILPGYMIPARYIQLDHFPLNANGKVDRLALAQTDITVPEERVEPPRSDLEVRIANVWREILRCKIGRDQNFFELGGNSLKAVTLLAQIEDQVGVEISFSTFYNNPTIADLAIAIGHHNQHDLVSSSVLLNSSASEAAPLFCIEGVHLYHELAVALEPYMAVYGVYLPEVQSQLTDIARHKPHKRFISTGAAAKYYIESIIAQQPCGPYRLAGFSYGGLIAYEIAQQLTRGGEEVEALIILDMPLTAQIASSQGIGEIIKHNARISRVKLAQCFGSDDSSNLQRILAADEYERHCIEPYAGSVLLCRALGEPRTYKRPEPSLGWHRYVDNITVQDCPGKHHDLLAQGNSALLADAITDYVLY